MKPTRTQVEYCWTATPAVCLYALDARARARRDHLPRRRPDVLLRPGAALRRAGRRRASLIVPHRYAPEHRRKEPDERHLQRRMADVPSRPGRARGAAVVARPVHRVVLLPRRGREDRATRSTSTTCPPLRARARARASRRRARAVERHEPRARRNARHVLGRRPAARLLPLPLAAPLPPGPRQRGSQRRSGYLRPGVPPLPLAWTSNYGVPQRRAAARLGAVPSRDRSRAGRCSATRERGRCPACEPCLCASSPCGRAAQSPVA